MDKATYMPLKGDIDKIGQTINHLIWAENSIRNLTSDLRIFGLTKQEEAELMRMCTRINQDIQWIGFLNNAMMTKHIKGEGIDPRREGQL